MNQQSDDSPARRESVKREERRAELAQAYHRFIEEYPRRWKMMIEQWSGPVCDHLLWVMYSASYLSCFGGARWAMDPVRLGNQEPHAPEPDLSPLNALDFVLLTHKHQDHVDTQLWRQLRDAPVRWVVPEYMVNMFQEATGISDERLVIPQPLKTMNISGVTITPFEGAHWEWEENATPGTTPRCGVPAMGYLLEAQGKRWLFPGDTRTFNVDLLPDFGPVDVVFAHVWLGRDASLLETPPRLEEFCRFITGLKPQEKVVLAHLYQTSRTPENCWVQCHADMIIKRLKELDQKLTTIAPGNWDCLRL